MKGNYVTEWAEEMLITELYTACFCLHISPPPAPRHHLNTGFLLPSKPPSKQCLLHIGRVLICQTTSRGDLRPAESHGPESDHSVHNKLNHFFHCLFKSQFLIIYVKSWVCAVLCWFLLFNPCSSSRTYAGSLSPLQQHFNAVTIWGRNTIGCQKITFRSLMISKTIMSCIMGINTSNKIKFTP